MRQVFVDTGPFFAGLSRTDEHHARASAFFANAARERQRLVTTNMVVAETHGLLLLRGAGGRPTALAFLEQVLAGAFHLVRPGAEDERRAIAIIRAHDDKGYSLCDAVSFVVMERLHIRDVFAFDHHFREYGKFTVL